MGIVCPGLLEVELEVEVVWDMVEAEVLFEEVEWNGIPAFWGGVGSAEWDAIVFFYFLC